MKSRPHRKTINACPPLNAEEFDTDDPNKLTPEQLQEGIEGRHPAAYYILAAKLFAGGKKDDAVFWFYLGQLRYRFHLAANPELDPPGDPALFASRLKAITEQSYDMKRALEAFDLKHVGRIMTENHNILIDMNLSHDILIHLCNLALEKGAFGAKVTGGGRGGYMVALTPGKALQDVVASAIEAEGYKVIRASVG